VKTIKPSLIEEIKQDIKSTLQDDVTLVVREIEDQKTRAMNLIFFNVPESEDKNNGDRSIDVFSLFFRLSTLGSIITKQGFGAIFVVFSTKCFKFYLYLPITHFRRFISPKVR
jgi:hypothetical protein